MIVDAEGWAVDPLERAEQLLSYNLSRSLHGTGADERVALLRESITGERAPRPQLTGLDYWLPKGPVVDPNIGGSLGTQGYVFSGPVKP